MDEDGDFQFPNGFSRRRRRTEDLLNELNFQFPNGFSLTTNLDLKSRIGIFFQFPNGFSQQLSVLSL